MNMNPLPVRCRRSGRGRPEREIATSDGEVTHGEPEGSGREEYLVSRAAGRGFLMRAATCACVGRVGHFKTSRRVDRDDS